MIIDISGYGFTKSSLSVEVNTNQHYVNIYFGIKDDLIFENKNMDYKLIVDSKHINFCTSTDMCYHSEL